MPHLRSAVHPGGQAPELPVPLPPTAAYRRRKRASLPLVAIPEAQPRRPVTVYECEACGTRAVGEQRCEGCGAFMRRVGYGGPCPHCDEPVAVSDLLGEGVGR